MTHIAKAVPVVLLLVAASAHAQAVRPAPVARPLIEQQPPSYPVPTYTPNGAGASRDTLVSPQPAAPRSPNKRLLPPTKEAGLWAADGAPVAVHGTRLFGVDIPRMMDDEGRTVAGDTDWCARGLAKAADATGWRGRVEGHAYEARGCMAALAYFRCAADHFKWLSTPATPGNMVIGSSVRMADATAKHARELRDVLCRDVTLSDEQKRALDAIIASWAAATAKER